ncbi:MAG: hypothetical protein ACFB2Z_13960 [Maricaulaceae bacterium]
MPDRREDPIKAAHDKRNKAIAWSLVGMMVLIFVATLVRLTQNATWGSV